MTAQHNKHSAHHTTESGWRELVDFLSDWYWEQDEHLRFTMISGKRMREQQSDTSSILGKTRWEQERIWDVSDSSWEEHKATLYAHQPFVDFIYKITARNGELRYISVSGQPIFDEAGKFTGYRGIGKDVTVEVRAELRRTIEHAVTQILSTANSMMECAQAIIRTICETLNWSCGAYWEYGEKQNALQCLESWCQDDTPGTQEYLALRKNACGNQHVSTLAQSAWHKGEPVWLSDIHRHEILDASAEPAISELHSAFVLPVKIGAQVISVLEFYSKHIHQPDTELLECSAFIANQISQFTQLMRAREQLQQSEERFRSLIELSSDWIWEQDEHFRFTLFAGNEAMQQRTGINPSSRIDATRWDMPALNLSEEDWEQHRQVLLRHETFHDFIIRRNDTNGRERWMSVSGTPIFDSKGEFKGYRGIVKDISERKIQEQRVQFLATHDALTGLPNRSLFSELLNRAILNGRRYERKFALLFIDLDRFKVINDSLGHDAGDMLLKVASARLLRAMRSSDVVGRLGGDEFVVLVQEIEQVADVEIVARKILSTLFRPVKLLEQECRVTGSMGIALFPAHAQDEQSLMKHADAAMYAAKEAGKNQYRFYSEAIRSQPLERVALEASLRHAIEREQLFLHYQAKLDLKTRRITGVEALLRWQHPELGMVSPAKFIPLAEETGLILPIGRWVLRKACAQNMAWQRAGLPPVLMAVNLSASQFIDDALITDVEHALDTSGMPASLLELELTESMVVQDPAWALTVLQRLKQMGLRLAIDDFGTGYSSLAQLKRFPIDTLKVDKSFIQDIPANDEDKTMTKAIIAMGKSLGLTVVAEGVETEAQQAFLSDNACDETQGFYFSKPVAANDIEDLLRKHS